MVSKIHRILCISYGIYSNHLAVDLYLYMYVFPYFRFKCDSKPIDFLIARSIIMKMHPTLGQCCTSITKRWCNINPASFRVIIPLTRYLVTPCGTRGLGLRSRALGMRMFTIWVSWQSWGIGGRGGTPGLPEHPAARGGPPWLEYHSLIRHAHPNPGSIASDLDGWLYRCGRYSVLTGYLWSNHPTTSHQQTVDIHPMLAYCWVSVADDGPH